MVNKSVTSIDIDSCLRIAQDMIEMALKDIEMNGKWACISNAKDMIDKAEKAQFKRTSFKYDIHGN